DERTMSEHLALKGHWNKTLLAHDALIAVGVLGGGAWMAWTYFKQSCDGKFLFQ
nr:6K2 protein [Mediterranean ruda virus]